jgi:hypothetical protein
LAFLFFFWNPKKHKQIPPLFPYSSFHLFKIQKHTINLGENTFHGG